MKTKKIEQSLSTKNRLLKSALKIFSQKGFGMASIREIAEDSGTTLPSIYYHFGSKEGLYRQLIEKHISRSNYLFDENKQAGSARKKIQSFVTLLYQIMIKDIDFVRLTQVIATGSPQSLPPFDFKPFQKKFRDTLIAMINEGIKSGEFHSRGNAADMAWVILGVMQMAEQELCFNLFGGYNQKTLQRILDLVLDGFSADK